MNELLELFESPSRKVLPLQNVGLSVIFFDFISITIGELQLPSIGKHRAYPVELVIEFVI